MAVIYKILFEVNLLHEYYLTNIDGKTIFELPDQDSRIDHLHKEYEKGRESVSKDLEFHFPDEFKQSYESYCLKLLPTYSGFRLAVRVDRKKLQDGTIVYKPLIAMPNDLNIFVIFSKRSSVLDNYSNIKINSPLPGTYYFTNQKTLSDKSFPFLTNPIAEFDSNHTYEQGELVSFGGNDIRGYFLNDSADQWELFSGTAFANESDRVLLPLKFTYSFPSGSNVTEATFNLKSRGGELIKSTYATSTEYLRTTMLNFSDVLPSQGLTTTLYSLEVNGNNGYIKRHPIIFSSFLQDKSIWAIASFLTNAADPNFSLFAPDGYLIARKPSAGAEVKAKVFEIPIKARLVYYRYINDRRKPVILPDSLKPYLREIINDESNSQEGLASLRPKTVTKEFFKLQKEGATETKYFPGPTDFTIKKDESGRLYYDIIVPNSELFRVIT